VLRMPLATGVIPGVGGPAPFPPRPPLRMLCAGRLMPEKGFDLAIAAANLLADRGVEVSLDIMGDGPLRGSLEAAAAAARAPVRVLPGGRSELWEAIDAAHVVLAPSRREGLGLVALEALARGRPVIATRVGGLVEVVECPDDGALVAPEDAGALAKAVEELAIAHPRARAAAAHSPEAVIEAHLRAYQRAAGRVASRGSGASRG
jgi:colanic acid/amylovoran biosynthesis glycosyltransferase